MSIEERSRLWIRMAPSPIWPAPPHSSVFLPLWAGPSPDVHSELMLVVLTKHWEGHIILQAAPHAHPHQNQHHCPALFPFPLASQWMFIFFFFFLFCEKRIFLWIRTADLGSSLLVFSAFPQGGGYYFISFSPCQTMRLWSATETQVCFLVQEVIAAENMIDGFSL